MTPPEKIGSSTGGCAEPERDPVKEEGIRWTIVRRLFCAPCSQKDGETLTYDNAVSEYEDIRAALYLRYGYAGLAERCRIRPDPTVTGKG